MTNLSPMAITPLHQGFELHAMNFATRVDIHNVASASKAL